MRLALLLGCCLVLCTACTDGDGGLSGNGGASTDPIGDPNGAISVTGFTINGTSALRNGAVPIETQANQGRFTMNYTVPSGNPNYTARLAVSTDQAFDSAVDRVIVEGCGKTSVVDSCHSSVTFDCTYSLQNTAMVMTCVDALGLSKQTSLTSFFSGRSYPTNAFILVNVCNAFLSSCDTESVPVFFN